MGSLITSTTTPSGELQAVAGEGPATSGENGFMLAEDYAHAAIADNTKLAHKKDMQRFIAWGGAIPATTYMLCAYLTEHATTHKVATLSRWLSSISMAHQAAGIPVPPTRDLSVRKTLAGIIRVHGAAQRRVSPMVTEELKAITRGMKADIVGVRNKAMLLVAFSGAMRRSELVKLEVKDIHFLPQGMMVSFGQSKTDQAGEDKPIAIPFAQNKTYCPVLALQRWLATAGIEQGPVFCAISRHGKLSPNAMSTQAVANIVKQQVELAGMDKSLYSGHSMRAGLATSAAAAAKPYSKIRAITRHKSDATLARYIRDGEDFKDNAADLL